MNPSYGPNPWPQAHWDWRAAGNFICGGAGSGLVLFTVLSRTQGLAATLLLLAGLGLVGLGLLCVWAEIGRPWRAVNVFLNPRTSWMTREAFVAVLLFALGLGMALGLRAWAAPVAAAALAFVYCQARIVQAAKGIPAWREPLSVALLVVSGLAEGGGLFCLATAAAGSPSTLALLLFAALVVARALLARAWRRRVARVVAPRALEAIDASGRALEWLGGVVPLVLASTVIVIGVSSVSALLLMSAGLLAAGAGAWFKFVLITRAAFNQGFALVHLPVRGVPR